MIPTLGFCGASGSGKTTLLCRVVADLSAQGLAVGVLKHHGHAASAPPAPAEPKDTDRLLAAGAARAVLAEPGGLTLWSAPRDSELPPAAMVALLMGGLDLALVEGFKGAELDKIEVVAPGQDPWLPPGGRLLAIARRGGSGEEAGLPVLDADDPAGVARFVRDWLAAQPKASLLVDGRQVPINHFVRDMLQNTLRGFLANLKDGGGGQGRIEVRLDQP